MLLGPLVLLTIAAESRGAEPVAPDAGQPEYPQVIRRDGLVCVITLEADGTVAENCRADPALRSRTTNQPGSAPAQVEAATVVPSRVGVVGVAGGEGAFATDGPFRFSFRPRVGAGLRVALTPPTAGQPLPSLALVGGYAGLNDARIFVELRTELLVPQATGMLMPGFTGYALGGVDALLAGGVDPYVGVGVGWDHNIFAPSGGTTVEEKPQRGGGGWNGAGLSGLGNLGNGLGYILIPLVAVAVAVVGVIGFICAGRVEVRYHAGSSRNAGPLSRPVPTVAVLFGFGV